MNFELLSFSLAPFLKIQTGSERLDENSTEAGTSPLARNLSKAQIRASEHLSRTGVAEGGVNYLSEYFRSFRIAELSFGSSQWDRAFSFKMRDQLFNVERFGADFSVEYMHRLLREQRARVDAFAITSLPSEIRFRDKTYAHRQALEIMSTPVSVPLCNGDRLKELANINGLSQAISNGRIHPEKGVYFPVGLMNLEATGFLLEKYGEHLYFGDAYSVLGLPIITQPASRLLDLSKLAINIANLRDLGDIAPQRKKQLGRWSHQKLIERLKDVRYLMADPAMLLQFAHNDDISFVRGKELIFPYAHPEMEAALMKGEPAGVVHLFPETYRRLSPYMTHSVLDAALRLSHDVETPLSLEEWQELLATETDVTQATRRYVLGSRPSTQVRLTKSLGRVRRKITRQATPDFAFVIHCLSYDYLYKTPILGPLLEHAPVTWAPVIESNLAKLPGIVYGRAGGIVSRKTGREVNGLIYALFATPKAMRNEAPEVTYAKIDRLCRHAAEEGAKIIGLGAYTKIVGDAGATINRNSPIPVTTGNSLSASATLWALHEAVTKMRLLKLNPETGLVDGTATIIGATGSIGKVSAKLLAMVFSNVCIVAPKQDRLDDLKHDLEKLAPKCRITTTTDANQVANITDVLVTATSAFDQKIIDIARLKPGCIVCDCSRPLDFSEQDAISRPDILIIESGEVLLPGSGRQFTRDLGLPGNVAYACLGETAVLAMENRFEAFTLGREIEWTKVKEIYKLARDHGVELAAIRGLSGVISDREIELTREHAIRRLRSK